MYTLFLTKPEPADIKSVIIFKQLGGGGGENCRGTNRERADEKNNVQNESNPLEAVMCALVWVEYAPREVKCAVIRLGQCDILRQQLSCCTHAQPPLEIPLFLVITLERGRRGVVLFSPAV